MVHGDEGLDTGFLHDICFSFFLHRWQMEERSWELVIVSRKQWFSLFSFLPSQLPLSSLTCTYMHAYMWVVLFERFSLCSSDWPWTLNSWSSYVLGLKASITMPGLKQRFSDNFRIFEVNSIFYLLMNLLAKAMLGAMRYSKTHKHDLGFQGDLLLSLRYSKHFSKVLFLFIVSTYLQGTAQHSCW